MSPEVSSIVKIPFRLQVDESFCKAFGGSEEKKTTVVVRKKQKKKHTEELRSQ